MRSKSTIAFFVVASLSLMLIAGGCRRNSRHAQATEGSQTENIAPSDVKTADKAAGKPSDKASNESSDKAAVLTDPAANTSETNSIVDQGGEGVDFPERQEIRRSYKLDPEANINVSRINGRVDIETAEIDHAEVLIVRSARKKEDFQFRKVNIEHTSEMLHIRVEEDRRSIFSEFGSIPEGRQRVMLKLPRKVALDINRVNGNVTVGEIDGSVEVSSVNGLINIAQVTESAAFRHVNGKIDATIANLSDDGIDLSGVNGNSTLRFIGEVNADVLAHGMNGKVEADLPDVEVKQGERRYGRYEARIGAGGAEINIRGVNGNVKLLKSEKTVAVTAKPSSKWERLEPAGTRNSRTVKDKIRTVKDKELHPREPR